MTDSTNEKRPVRKLTVKNFSVIKEAALEFGKITVLIGPQASGKSLLCKLAHFFEKRVPEIVFSGMTAPGSLHLVEEQVLNNFLSYFPEEDTQRQGFQICYEVEPSYSICIEMNDASPTPHVTWKDGFIGALMNWLARDPKGPPSFNSDRRRALMSGADIGPMPIKSDSVYIPTGRAFYSTPNRAYAVLSTKNLDWITSRYATEFDAEFRDLRESYQTNRVLLKKVGTCSIEMLKGKVVQEEGRLFFESIEDRTKRPFEILSSGTLELLPIFNTLAQVAKNTGYPDHSNMPAPQIGTIYIEEPELSVFPETQYQFAKLIALLADSNFLWNSYAITTHSPYILTAFNDLIKAGQAAKTRPERTAEIEKIIPKEYWISEGDFAAYAFDGKDGILHSIMDEETKLINGDVLDDISETISGEFGQLLEIQYGD